MKRVERIFLVRHGESMGNVDKDVHRTHADHAIPLSPRGHEQALSAGRFLRSYLDELESVRRADLSRFARTQVPYPHRLYRCRLWTSPYLRTRQTSDGLVKGIEDDEAALNGYESPIIDRRENIALCEQQFGLFDGIPDEELPSRYPDEHAHYAKQEEFEGRFWARMPMGESRWDVAIRVHQAFGTWHRDAERHHIRNIVVVSHGVTIRCIVMRWLHLPAEWIEDERNPKNCSIRLIENHEDKGYIYKGG